MAIQVLMPKIGLTMTEGKIVEWKKREGEWVNKGEILFVFETEKVAFEVEAPQSGFLAKILAQVDEVVPIGGVVGMLIEKEGEKVEVIAKKPEAVPEGVEKKILEVRPERAEKIRATPMAKKIAKERGIDLKSVSGSGIGGRIKSRDVEATLNIRSSEQILPRIGEEKLVKLSGMRRIIAQRCWRAR